MDSILINSTVYIIITYTKDRNEEALSYFLFSLSSFLNEKELEEFLAFVASLFYEEKKEDLEWFNTVSKSTLDEIRGNYNNISLSDLYHILLDEDLGDFTLYEDYIEVGEDSFSMLEKEFNIEDIIEFIKIKK